jgi:hypothetical protein
LGHFPISCKCWISCIELNIYSVKLQWLLETLNFHLQRLIMVWGTFPSFLNVGYHLLNWYLLFTIWMIFKDLDFYLQRLVVVWGNFPSFVDIGYCVLNLVFIL